MAADGMGYTQDEIERVNHLVAADFQPLVGAVATIIGATGEGELTLDDVRVAAHPAPFGRPHPFSLTFSAAVMFPQGLYRLRFPTLGELPIFLVPIAPTETRACYQATFT